MDSLIFKFSALTSVSLTSLVSLSDEIVYSNTFLLALSIAISVIFAVFSLLYYIKLMDFKIKHNKETYFKAIKYKNVSLFRQLVLANPKKAAKYLNVY